MKVVLMLCLDNFYSSQICWVPCTGKGISYLLQIIHQLSALSETDLPCTIWNCKGICYLSYDFSNFSGSFMTEVVLWILEIELQPTPLNRAITILPLQFLLVALL